MTLYNNGETVWTYEQMRDVVFPAEIEGLDTEQFIGGSSTSTIGCPNLC
jgi:hypothetical protein